MTEPVVIGHGACKWVKESGTKMITLCTAAPQGTYSMHTSDNYVDYQVPTGKKFILLNISCSVGRNNANADINMIFYKNTTTNSTSGGTIIARSRASVNYQGQAGIQNQNMPVYIEIPAGNYIISSFGHHGEATVIGIETDV